MPPYHDHRTATCRALLEQHCGHVYSGGHRPSHRAACVHTEQVGHNTTLACQLLRTTHLLAHYYLQDGRCHNSVDSSSHIVCTLNCSPYLLMVQRAGCCCPLTRGPSLLTLPMHAHINCSPDTLMMELHPNAKMVLGLRNIAFMHGPQHKALRRSFLALFTRRALSSYVQKQDVVIRDHLREWMEQGAGPRERRMDVRDMNAYTSQEVFVGWWLGRSLHRLV